MSTVFKNNLKVGLVGESAIAQWLRRRGWNVLPAYEVEVGSGKGPRLYTAFHESLITPDMLIFQGDRLMWVEAKTKTAFTWYRISQTWQDGIDRRHWTDYKRVASLTSWPVWLLFLHTPGNVAKDTPYGEKPPIGLFGQTTQRLFNCIDHESDNHAHGMVYWNLCDLKKIANWPLP